MKNVAAIGGGEDASVGLWVMAYNIKYMDDRRLGVGYDEGNCPDNFVGVFLHSLIIYCSLICCAQS